MKFQSDERQLSITMSFDQGEVVTPVAIEALIAKGESRKFWEVRAIVPVQYRYLDCFDDFYEESSDGATVTLRKSVGVRAPIRRSA